MSQKFNNPSEVNLSSEANMLLTDLTSEESAAINGGVGFFKSIGRGFKNAFRAIGDGASHFILNGMMDVAKNPWSFATGGQQRDATEMDAWSRKG